MCAATFFPCKPAVSGIHDHPSYEPGKELRSRGSRFDDRRPFDTGPQSAVEPPLRRKFPAPFAGQPCVKAVPTLSERFESGGCRELAAAHREAKTIAGHRIDE